MLGREHRDHVCRMQVCLLWAGDDFEWVRPTSAEPMETSKVANSKQDFMAVSLRNRIAMSRRLVSQCGDHRGGCLPGSHVFEDMPSLLCMWGSALQPISRPLGQACDPHLGQLNSLSGACEPAAETQRDECHWSEVIPCRWLHRSPEIPATICPCLQSFLGLTFSAPPYYSLTHPRSISEHAVWAGHCPRF